MIWLLSHWYVPAAVLLLAAGLIFWNRRRTSGADTPETVQQELALAEAVAEVKRVRAELGLAQAQIHVEQKYRDARAALTKDQADKAKHLERDPVALAKFLVKVGAAK